MRFLSAVSFQFDVLIIEFITFNHCLYKGHLATCDVATYLTSVLTRDLDLTHISKRKTCFQRDIEFLSFFSKKIIYKEKCGTVTGRNQNLKLVQEV